MAFSFAETSYSGLTTSVLAVASDGAGKIVAVGQDSVSLYSTNGSSSFTWGNIDYGNWLSIAYGGGRFVALNDSSGQAAYSTDNGANFTTVSIGAYLTDIAYGAGRFVAFNGNGGYTSTNGTSWSAITPPESWSLRASTLVWNGTYFLIRAFSGSKVYKSTDGLTWTAHASTFNAGVRRLAWNGSRFTGLSRNSSAGEYSTDGITWTAITLPVSQYWTHIVWNGYRWLGVAGDQSTPTYVTSTDGETWSQASFATTSYWRALCTDGLSIIAFSSSVKAAIGTGDTVIQTGSATLPLAFAIKGYGAAVLPLALAVRGLGQAVLPLAVSSVEASIASGESPVSDGGSGAAVWQPVVVIDGVDMTDRVIGDIVIDAEEGAARVADLTLQPAAGSIVLADWTGRSITIDIADNRTGTPAGALRLFTGRVDLPSIDLNLGQISLSCTDDLQNRIDQMTREQIDAVVAGRWSPVVFDKGAAAWTYLQDVLSTVPASVDLSPSGVLRRTDWAAKSTPDLAFGEDDIFEQSLAVTLAQRSGIINRVAVDFGYRTPKMKAEGYQVSYDIMAANDTSFAYWVQDGGVFLMRESIVSAIQAARGTVESIDYTALPTTSILLPNESVWLPNPATDPLMCLGFTAVVSFDYAQYVDEQYAITVEAPESVSRLGSLRETMSGALEGQTVDVVASETSTALYKMDITIIPPTGQAVVVAGYTTAKTATLTDETNRDAANGAMECLIDVAKARIAGSHRGNRVSFAVPLNPVIDVDKTLHVLAQGVEAQGKVGRVRHVMSAASAEATSEAELVISAVGGVGISHPADATATTTADADGVTEPLAPPVVTWDGTMTGNQVITITFPGVEAAERNKATQEIERTVRAAVAEDVFTITI